MEHPIVIIGGGAAGVFAAIHAAAKGKVILLEKGSQLLAKVRISGGGRCNVTHHCFDPQKLTQKYPRGSRELLGPFTRFQPRDTVRWFEERGVSLKTEEDGRMFPITDSSETIIQCLTEELHKNNVEVRFRASVREIQKKDVFILTLDDGSTLTAKSLMLATGSSRHGHLFAESLGHTTTPLVPSLFTFNVPTSPLLELTGASVPKATLSLKEGQYKQKGPLLLTHWGFSGPAALKLSAWEARTLFERNYKTDLIINWTSEKAETLQSKLLKWKEDFPGQIIGAQNLFDIPKKLWRKLLELTKIDQDKKFRDLSKKELVDFARKLTHDIYQVDGKTTNKEEFVTCGGITLKEVHFQRMESKLCPGLFFAGEILDIDGVTGGFNFQNAWTTSYIAAENM
jgi:predicted Rossmann fold flavoprotein